MFSLYNTDCFNLIKNIPDSCIDLIITDPPYQISGTQGGGSINKAKKLDKSLEELVDANIVDGYDIETFGEEVIRIMNEINIYIWCNKIQIPAYFDYWVNKKKCKFDILYWWKNNAMPAYHGKYLTDTEYCLYFRSTGKCFPSNYEDAKTCYIAPINIKDKKLYGHPTPKPVPFLEAMVRNSSKEGDIILDTFTGSGSTGVAALKNNRHFIGTEINKDYYEKALERLKNTELELLESK